MPPAPGGSRHRGRAETLQRPDPTSPTIGEHTMATETHTTSKATRRALLAGIAGAAVAAPVVALPATGTDPAAEIGAKLFPVSDELRALAAAIAKITDDLEARGVTWWLERDGRRWFHWDVEKNHHGLPERTRARLLRETADQRDRYLAAYAEAGGPALDARQTVLEREEAALVDALLAAPAPTLAGVLAKLRVVLLFHPDAREDTDLPWSHFRSAVADLERIAGGAA
jgi:hypothetical protein